MENQTNKLLPYQLLLRKNNIQESDLDRGTQHIIAEIKKIRNVLFAQSQRKGVKFEVSENTQEKINTFDRHICDDIWNYLDELEEKNSSSESHSQNTNSQTTKQVTNDTEPNDSEKSGRVGFWNWE